MRPIQPPPPGRVAMRPDKPVLVWRSEAFREGGRCGLRTKGGLFLRGLSRPRGQLVPAVALVARVLVVLVPLGRSLPDAERHLPRLREDVRIFDRGLVVDIVGVPDRPALDHVERWAVE